MESWREGNAGKKFHYEEDWGAKGEAIGRLIQIKSEYGGKRNGGGVNTILN